MANKGSEKKKTEGKNKRKVHTKNLQDVMTDNKMMDDGEEPIMVKVEKGE